VATIEEARRRKAENQRKHYCRNKERVLEQIKEYQLSDKGKKAKNRANARRRKTIEHREYHRQYCANKYKNDINYRIALNLRNRLGAAVNADQKSGSAVKDLGCSIVQFKKHIESLWSLGMSWDNYGHGLGCWNFDHVDPLSKFDLTDIFQLKQACHYTNIQPLWSSDNYSKGCK
jgi:hypothetical protein